MNFSEIRKTTTCTAALAACVMGIVSFHQSTSSARAKTVVSAEEVTLTDADGRVTMRLSGRSNAGGPSIEMISRDGARRARIDLEGGVTPRIELCDPTGRTVMRLAVDGASEPVVELSSGGHAPSVRATIRRDGPKNAPKGVVSILGQDLEELATLGG